MGRGIRMGAPARVFGAGDLPNLPNPLNRLGSENPNEFNPRPTCPTSTPTFFLSVYNVCLYPDS